MSSRASSNSACRANDNPSKSKGTLSNFTLTTYDNGNNTKYMRKVFSANTKKDKGSSKNKCKL